jgi:dipeptidyl aminopeptidase/acylaminoacyl peptidase
MAFTPTPTMTATPEIRFTRQCLPIEDREVALNEVASGTIFVSWTGPSVKYYESLSALHDLQTGNEYLLPSSLYSERAGFISSEISPNQKMLAKLQVLYDRDRGVPGLKYIGNAVQVFDARANLIAKLTFNRADLVWLHWLDNERLIIDTEKYGTLLLVNPFTGEQQTLADDLPNLYPYELNKKNFPWWPVVYSPDLDLVAYHSQYKDGDEYRSGAVLYDLVSKQILWKKDEGVSPAWSPDGKVLAFTTVSYEGRLYLFSRPGPVRAVLDESLPHQARVFSWSPDGRYIAFWNAESLMIYDRQMDWVFDTCISSNQDIVSPRWSPDSRQILVYVSGYSTELMLVNWEEKRAYKIKEFPHDELNGRIYGWMNSVP